MTMQENPVGYKFTILSEDVASNDLFEDKTHERVSENLYKIIQGSAKGVTIGLEGSWGSGKSTVIKLLKDKLTENSDNKTLFFMFDAWAHDGDPLRRIFLESLIREIDPNENDEELNSIKGKITGRKKIVEVKSKKSASRLGKLISLSALLIPLGSALLGKVNYDLLVWPWYDGAHYFNTMLALGLTFCLSPAWILLYWCVRGDKVNNKISWDFFSVDTREDYTQDITEDGERTSIEFEDHFQCIIKTATKKELIDKCIVVIDNLDRVDPGHAKSIWSTLQTFFQKRSSGNIGVSWSDKLWFVIPFDYDGFLKIWGSTDVSNDIGKSFLKKCFQLIAEVPHPVMSGWSKYAETCINEALREWPEDERKNVLSTYVRYASRLDKSPTPRDIKVFANQVGLLGAMWGGELSVEAICLYTLFKESYTTDDLRGELVAGQLPQSYQTDLDRSVICAELAGLLFGVNKQKGLQLLLGPEIKSAFNQGNGKVLSTLLEDHGSAFWIAYEASKPQWMITIDHIDEYRIAFTKALHDGLVEHPNRIIRETDALLEIWAESYLRWDFSQFDYSAPMRNIFNLSSGKTEFFESIQKSTLKKLSELISLVGDAKFPEKSLGNIRSLVQFLEDINKPLKKPIYTNLNGDKWKAWLGYLEKYNVSYEMVLPKQETINELANETLFSSPGLSESALSVLIKTYEIYPASSEWEHVVDQIVSWTNIRNRMYECEALYGFMLQLSISSNTKISSKIAECVKGAGFWAAGINSSSDNNPSLPLLAAISLKDDIQANSYVSPGIKSFWSETGDEKKLIHIFRQLKALNKLDVVWWLCRDSKNSVATHLIRDNDDEELYVSWVGANYIDEYEGIDEEELSVIAKKLVQHGAFSENESNMIGEPLTYQSVYKIFYPMGNSKVCSFIDSEVSKATKNDWLKCLADEGDLLELIKDKNHHFSDAMKDYLVKVVSDNKNNGIKSGLISRLPGLLRKTADLNVLIMPQVTHAYFKTSEDYLVDSLFNSINQFFEPHLSNVNAKSLMERINLWIDDGLSQRIEWLVKQDIKPFERPLETLMSRVAGGLKSEDIAIKEVARLVNDKFQLQRFIDEHCNDDSEKTVE